MEMNSALPSLILTFGIWAIPFLEQAVRYESQRLKYPGCYTLTPAELWWQYISNRIILDKVPSLIYFGGGVFVAVVLSGLLAWFVSPVASAALLVLQGVVGVGNTGYDRKNMCFIKESKGVAGGWVLLSMLGLFAISKLPPERVLLTVIITIVFAWLQFIGINLLKFYYLPWERR